jgi:hypothetical protein
MNAIQAIATNADWTGARRCFDTSNFNIVGSQFGQPIGIGLPVGIRCSGNAGIVIEIDAVSVIPYALQFSVFVKPA